MKTSNATAAPPKHRHLRLISRILLIMIGLVCMLSGCQKSGNGEARPLPRPDRGDEDRITPKYGVPPPPPKNRVKEIPKSGKKT